MRRIQAAIYARASEREEDNAKEPLRRIGVDPGKWRGLLLWLRPNLALTLNWPSVTLRFRTSN
jgi:hypothetical protein